MDRRKIKKNFIKSICFILAAFLFGLLAEGVYELNTWNKVRKNQEGSGISVISEEQIQTENIQYDGQYYHVNPESKMTLLLPDTYVKKLKFEYKANQVFDISLHVYDKNVYGRDAIEVFSDRCRTNLDESVINLNEKISKIEMTFSAEAQIKNLQVYNAFYFNWFRVLYYSVFAGMVLFLIFGAKIICSKLENAFVIIALSIGLLFVTMQPPGLISWDEHIHFFQSNSLLNRWENDWKEARDFIYDNPEEFPYVSILSLEEREAQIQQLNEMDGTQGKYLDAYPYAISNMGYVHTAVTAKLLNMLNVPFFTAFVLVKMVNLLLYVVLIWMAIRIVPTHKLLMTVLALMPTPMYMACAYSYDPMVIGCIFLGTAVMLREYYEPEKKLNWKRIALLCGAMVIGCCSKAVYIPLLLAALFLPESKFSSKKQRKIFRIVIVVVFLAMMSTFVLPAVFSSNRAGDSRGGNTNVTEQLKLIFTHLFGYIQVFFSNVWAALPDYLFGRESMAHLAYSGYLPSAALTGILAFTVAFTDKKAVCPDKGKKALRNFKLASLVCIFMVIGLIWTALYLSFTEVGMTAIAGVQGRYYLPFFFLLFYVIGDVSIENKMSPRIYRTIVLSVSVFMLFQMLYQPIYLTYCQ